MSWNLLFEKIFGKSSLAQGGGQLIGAGGGARAAMNAGKALDGLIDLHAARERRDTLRVAVAAAGEFDVEDDIGLGVDIDIDLAGAYPAGGVGNVLCHVFCIYPFFGLRFVGAIAKDRVESENRDSRHFQQQIGEESPKRFSVGRDGECDLIAQLVIALCRARVDALGRQRASAGGLKQVT